MKIHKQQPVDDTGEGFVHAETEKSSIQLQIMLHQYWNPLSILFNF